MSTMSPVGEKEIKDLSAKLGEPEWLTRFRLDSFGSFTTLPSEKNPLYTKYTKTFDLSLDGFKLGVPGRKVDFRSFFGEYLSGKESNIVLQGNDTIIHTELDDDLAAKGVWLGSLQDALKEDEDRVRSLFDTRTVRSEGDRMAAFTNAFFSTGVLVHVPPGVKVDKPLRRMLLLGSPESSIVEQVFVDAEEGAKVVFLEELYSKGESVPSLVASNLEVRAGLGSHVDYSSIQLLDERVIHAANRGVVTSNDSTVTASALCLGSLASRSRTNFYLNGRGSLAEGFEIFFTDQKQKFDFETNLVHNSPDTTGSTQARGVLKGDSQSIFKGMIKIVNAARNSRSYLAHHAMLLERTAKSDAVPSLEIDNNEVRATHSASVAQVDDEQLFYLMARGLNQEEARKMLVTGFFEPVLSRIPIEQTREGARFMIEGKWMGEKRRLIDREALLAATGEVVLEAKPAEDIFQRHYKYR